MARDEGLKKGAGVFWRHRLFGVNTKRVGSAQRPTALVRIGLHILKLTTFEWFRGELQNSTSLIRSELIRQPCRWAERAVGTPHPQLL